MSKRKHKKRNNTSEHESQNSVNNRNQFNNNSFGINPSQLLSMFGNIDMSQISNILQSMNTQGFDLNNLNLGPLQDMIGGMPNMSAGMPNMSGGMPNMSGTTTNKSPNGNIYNDTETINDDSKNERNTDTGAVGDPNIEMLMALRNIVDEERAIFVDKIIQHYNKGTFND